ncbi:hypothetical protein GYMLUDRAFT_970374 [Collybiopsis luxurians FD-317 M1]|uniref:Uncharacterized protein n=1 Tax=Collybiopsis luxurians FD-317 M1 TaxID=944289 RepID=A0A0D0C399_9AGAR|nr:hypothetical protein GYMLUDRAFT_970374 [Collybiopsis luxurians FD-317 M1]
MIKFPLDSAENSFSDLTQHIVSCVNVLSQKLTFLDDGLILGRLRHGDFIIPPSRSSEVDPFLEDARLRWDAFKENIGLMEEALCKLQKARDSFERSLNVALSLCTPIRALPEDVLMEIFSIYIKDQGRGRVGQDRRAYSFKLWTKKVGEERVPCIVSPTLHLSHICSFWRKILSRRPTL